jgi:hypothetical protein
LLFRRSRDYRLFDETALDGTKNINAACDQARNLLRCTDYQEAANLQAQFLNAQFETASRQLKELYGAPGSDVEAAAKISIEIR